MLDINDLMQTVDGKGVINVLAADQLMASPRLYSTFLLWLLSELFEQLPEVGDVEKPKLVFFDEAHLLFNEAPAALLEKIEQVVRLIRSKGVGVTSSRRNPLDIPDKVLGQLGNRVQHALRAFTPRDQKAVKTAAETLRANPAFDAAAVITELGVGEALVSFLDEKGGRTSSSAPSMLPPSSRIGPLTGDERKAVIAASLVYGVWQKGRRTANPPTKTEGADAQGAAAQQETAPAATEAPSSGGFLDGGARQHLRRQRQRHRQGASARSRGRHRGRRQSAARAIGSQVGREIIRGVLGSILGGGKRR